MSEILLLLTAHWFADFVCQSDWMALNKSKANWPLFVHVLIYTCVMGLAVMWLLPPGMGRVWFFVLTFVSHFATDYMTSRINSRLWAAKQNHWFFVSVGFDQLIHFYTLAWTLQLLTGLYR